ncbi:uridylate-specific endoribonuclease D-like [Crassostrea angulata]|uniref:uridylate-specific endoribonuclease D-like n=1 Tax=Magallana angulata TaxID=2784310 RepID=UPI0022B1AAF5|nr:uridylate-specific endoribonuclease D-like [Crassostrea angulata]
MTFLLGSDMGLPHAYILVVTGLATATAYVSESELSQFMTNLWNQDDNRASSHYVRYDLQGHSHTGHSGVDNAPNKFFDYVNEAHLFHKPTYSTFISLLNNYHYMTGTSEYQTSSEDTEVTSFLSQISQTNVIKLTQQFLHSKGYITGSMSDFLTTLRKIWFDFYPRSSHTTHLDTSGFEHVFVGETTSTKVDGFHNWIQYYLEEKRGNLNYLGFVYTKQPSIVGTHFLWHNKIKSLSSFIVGSSPEFDLAMYTACFFARRDVDCRFSMAGHNMDIKSYTVPFGTYHDLVATAYIN